MVGNYAHAGIRYRYKDKIRTVYAKCEHYNLTGSIKGPDGAFIFYKEHTRKGKFIRVTGSWKPSSGNTGIAFAAIGKSPGPPGHDHYGPTGWARKESTSSKSLGAEIILNLEKQKAALIGSIELSLKMAIDTPDIFLPMQFEKCLQRRKHTRKTTAPEIWSQLENIGLKTGRLRGRCGHWLELLWAWAKYFKKRKTHWSRFIPLEPRESPTLSTGYKVGSHRIQGISDEFIPAIVKTGRTGGYHQSIRWRLDPDGRSWLAKQLGPGQLAFFFLPGANILGAIHAQKLILGGDAVVVTILSDSNKKYLSTDLMKEEPVKRGLYITPEIELLDYTRH